MAYGLTPLGDSLMQPLADLIAWAERHQPEIVASRVRFDGRIANG